MANELGSHGSAVLECAEFYSKLATVLLALVAAWAFLFRERKLRLPPGPFPLPIIGNFHLLGQLPHQTLAALSLKYGPLISLRLGSALTLVVSSPDVAKEFLNNHDRVFANRPASAAGKYLMYNSSDIVFSPDGAYWRQLRKLCALQLLNARSIESLICTREEEVSAMIRSIINSDRPVSVTKTVSAVTNAMICRMAFGRKYSDQDLIDSGGIISTIKETILLLGSPNIGDYIPYLAWMDLQGINRRLKKLNKTQDEFLEKIIEEHVSQNNPDAAPDLVDVLLAASADEAREFQISRDNIKAVINDILVAGTYMSAIVIEWAMSEVLRNPTVLKKLQDELERVIGMERMVRESDLPSLVYLQAVAKETLRLHPPAPLALPHLSMEDCTVLGYEIPRGTRLLINLWAIGRNPNSWEDAESFKPERFMEDGSVGSKAEKFESIPFGAGRRGCPGRELATRVLEFVVAQLLQCFNWKLPDEISCGQQLDMTEGINGPTIPRKHELFAVPTPRLPIPLLC